MIILLFKTTILNSRDVNLVAGGLSLLVGVNNWSVDIGDEDKVLRLKTQRNIAEEVVDLLSKHGFSCEILK
ncbi:hypothetical protein [Chryseolinea soli]|uniref:Copper chaperone n=1 Tax=Chryseolinea soli TaxID=2321403 RepID=A0A385SN71_9BACT|nr:hypothetical protein [Chryseolinea soli]AYB31946.1 hypothetical protein D4L85_15840 [Chryseolinea soli]